MLQCEHRKIFKVCLVIFQHFTWKVWHEIERITTEFKPGKSFRFQEQVPTIEQLHIEVENLANQVNSFSNKKIVFCHNDLLCANYVFDEQNGKLIIFNDYLICLNWRDHILQKNYRNRDGQILKFLRCNKSLNRFHNHFYESVWYPMASAGGTALTKNVLNASLPP